MGPACMPKDEPNIERTGVLCSSEVAVISGSIRSQENKTIEYQFV